MFYVVLLFLYGMMIGLCVVDGVFGDDCVGGLVGW